jgi:putative CocE/NonD family hydrolase
MNPKWVLLSFAVLSLSGCIDTVDTYFAFEADDQYRNPGVFPGTYSFASTSQVLQPGIHIQYEPVLPEIIRLKSDLPALQGETNDGDVYISMAVWRPIMHENLTEPLPIIIDAGPYYEVGSHCEPNPNKCDEVVNDTIDYPAQMTPFLLNQFLPHGYAVAQIAVRGTGTSGGCMDLLGGDEQHDLNQAINYLAEQEWSNGNVAMIGASYDGSTPWLVAASGNPHLKTFVPISGLPSIHDLMFRNGSAETRGPIMYHQVYWPYGFSDEFPNEAVWDLFEEQGVPVGRLGEANDREQYQDLQNAVCPTVAESLAGAAIATSTGTDGGQATSFYTERDYRQRVIDNYDGSIFLVHGLQDFNVDPHSVVPFNKELREAGIPLKEWYGQWGHNTPDGSCVRQAPEWAVAPCRLDYADLLLRWFSTYLKDSPMETGPAIQVQDNVGFWRDVASFPAYQEWTELYLLDGELAATSGPVSDVRLIPGADGPMEVLRFEAPVNEKELRMSGMPQLKLEVTPEGEGGFVGAWLLEANDEELAKLPSIGCDGQGDCFPVGIPVIGHGQVNLLHATGEFAPVVPFQQMTVHLEMEPLEVVLSEGTHLELWVFQYQYPDHYGTFTPAPMTVHLGESKLRMPTLEVDPRAVFPVPGAHFPNTTYLPEMYQLKPALPPAIPSTVPTPPVPVEAITKLEVL